MATPSRRAPGLAAPGSTIRAAHEACAPPAPRPPLAARPRKLSVTSVETWIRDPYAIYARHILASPAVRADRPGPGRGRARHLHPRRARPVPARNIPAIARDAEADLLRIGARGIRRVPRTRQRARILVAAFRARGRLAGRRSSANADARIAQSFSEIEGSLRPARPRRATSRCRARPTASTASPTAASPSSITRPACCPRPARSRRATRRSFPSKPPSPRRADFRASRPPRSRRCFIGSCRAAIPRARKNRRPRPGAVAALASQALAGLKRLIAHFDDPRTPYRSLPQPERAPRYSDYTHLARVKEWLVGRGDRMMKPDPADSAQRRASPATPRSGSRPRPAPARPRS